MDKNIVNLDDEEIYLPKKVSFILRGTEYEIARPSVRKRMEYLKVGKSLQDTTDPEKAIDTLIELCLIAVPEMEKDILLEVSEEQLAKIIELVSDVYGIKQEDEEKNLPKKTQNPKKKKGS